MGDWDAQYNLGTFYEAGIGTARDAEQAKRWYIAAARQGQDEALEKCRAEGLSWE
ncbi:MAG: SEL1-like repeat protein [Oscillospiraceae bacterium]